MKISTFAKSTIYGILLSSAFMMSSCNSSSTDKTTKTTVVADLIQRGEKIQMGKEWDAVQNEYSDLNNAIQKDGQDHQSMILLSKLFIKEARVTGEHGHYYPGALALLDKVLADNTISDDMKFLALTTKAGVQLSLHEFQDALETGNEALAMNPANAQIYGVLVDANVELGNYDKAVKLMDRMVAIKPDIRSYSRVSYLREIHGDVDGSIEAMTMAVKAGYPGYEETAWAMLTLGDVYKQYGDLEKAEKVYQAILETRPNYPFAVGGLAEIQVQKGDDKSAEATLQQAMDIIPEVGFYVSMAELYKRQDRQDELDAIMKEIMVMLKEDTDSGHNMNLEYAHIYLDILEDTDKALEYAQLEYKKRPANIDVNRILAKVYDVRKNQDLVAYHLEKAKVTGSKHPELIELG